MNQPYGEAHYASKLTESDVVAIKSRLNRPCKCCGRKATYKDIAEQFGVSAVLIFKIKSGKAWKHV